MTTPPDFGRSVNSIPNKGGRSCPPNNTGTPGFSDLPAALYQNDARFVREVVSSVKATSILQVIVFITF